MSEFRARLLQNGAKTRLFEILLRHGAERDWLKVRDRQRSDSSHVLGAIRNLNQLELVGEAVRHALNTLAQVAPPDWLQSRIQPDWAVRLPTKVEWEKATRGENGLICPYGNEFDATKANTRETGIEQTSAVGIFLEGASPYGVADMSGNVWEWCQNQYFNPEHLAVDDRGDYRVVRGGSWYDSGGLARAAYRDFYPPPYVRVNNFGFRVRRPHL